MENDPIEYVSMKKDEVFVWTKRGFYVLQPRAREIPYNVHLSPRTQEAHSLEQASLDH